MFSSYKVMPYKQSRNRKQKGGEPKIIRIAGEKAWKYEMKIGEKLIFNKENKEGREWSADVDTDYFDFHSYQKNDKLTFTFTAKKTTEYTLIMLIEHSKYNKDDVFSTEPIVVIINSLSQSDVKEIKSDVRPIISEAKESLKTVKQDIKDNVKKLKYVDCPSITDCMKREFMEIDSDIANAIERIRKLEKQVGDMLIPMVSEQRYKEAEKEAKHKGFESDAEYQEYLSMLQGNDEGAETERAKDESEARIAGVSIEEYRRLKKERDEIAPELDIAVYLDAKRAGMTFKPPMLALEYLDYRDRAYKLGMKIEEYLDLEKKAKELDLTVEEVIEAKKPKNKGWFFGGNKKKGTARSKKSKRHHR